MFEKIARFSVRFRWLIIIFWILAVPILTAHLPNINNVTKNDNSQFLPKSSPSTAAVNLESSFQPKGTASTSTIVAVRQNGPLTVADNQAIDRIIPEVKSLHGVNSVIDQGESADGKARQLMVGISGAGFGQQATTIVNNIRAQLHDNLPSGLQIHLTGQFAESVDSSTASNHGRDNTELYTVIFIIVLLLLVFRSVLAPIVTLIPAGLALAVAQPVIAESTKIGVQVSFITQILLIVLILGAGTDYGLFLVFRVREELRRGSEPKEAVVKALSKVGESITYSAATVAAALLSLLLASFGLYQGLGPALAIGLGIMLLIALTFLPALLAIMGRAVFWPSKTKATELKIGLWGKLADNVIKRPVTMLVVGVVIFGGLALGIMGYKTTGFTSTGAPANSDSAIGQQVITQHFPAANNNPQFLLLAFNQPVWNNLAVISKAQAQLASSGAFKAIGGPFNVNGLTITPAALQKLHASSPDSIAVQAVRQFISPDGKTVQLYAISNAGVSGSAAATAATPSNRAILQRVARSVGAKQSAIYSTDAIGYDINHTATRDLEKIIPIVLLIIAALLAILLRSLVAPWYLILTVGLSYIGSLGFAMIAFVHLGGQDGLNFILPFLMFIFCMALGEDYNILVMSRIREEAHNHESMSEAVTKAIGITGTTVTSAGLILAGTFTVLGLVGGNQQVQQIGFGIAFGILLDTFFVRTLLVPSIVALLGRWNWWPSKLYRESK
ncbi:MAG TPA: MMPL family transporter [Verrucomicrobiae bacterium]|jgi:RND superfamily putative drug exporter|nr:MMPL family transporter [Verrucomicrobiae bacterium]